MTLPFAIHVFGAKPHQAGRAYAGDDSRSRRVLATDDGQRHASGPCIELVRDHKALTAKGRALLRKAS